MFYSYILKSIKDGTYYYGSTDNLKKRLETHNSCKVRYTKGHKPYILHYYEEYSTRREAFLRERFYKSIEGYKWLRVQGIIA